jgi:hypothetical protein
MGQDNLQGLYWLVSSGRWWTKTVGQMGQEKLHGLYWLVSVGGWWNERQWDRWEKKTAWFVLVSEWWGLVE